MNSDILKANSIAQTFAEKNRIFFWQDIHKCIGKKSILPSKIDGETDSNKIANNFACKYEELYNTVSFYQIEINELIQNVTSNMKHRCIEGGCKSQHHISVINIESAMKHIKSNKKDGFDDLSTSHLIHASSVSNIGPTYVTSYVTFFYSNVTPWFFTQSISIFKVDPHC